MWMPTSKFLKTWYTFRYFFINSRMFFLPWVISSCFSFCSASSTWIGQRDAQLIDCTCSFWGCQMLTCVRSVILKHWNWWCWCHQSHLLLVKSFKWTTNLTNGSMLELMPVWPSWECFSWQQHRQFFRATFTYPIFTPRNQRMGWGTSCNE